MAQALLKLAPTDFPGQQPISSRKVLSVKGLGKAYKSQQRVLDDINFDLHAGEFVAVIGRSGAGKSTLLHTLNGTIPSSCGEMLHLKMTAWRRISPNFPPARCASGVPAAA